MKTMSDFRFEYKDGYYLIQEKRVTEDSGKEYWTPRKTYPTKAKAKASITKYNLPSDEVDAAYQESYLKSCMKKSKPDNFKRG